MARIAHLSDCHLFGAKSQRHYDTVPYDTLCQVLEHVNAVKPDGILITGDISGDNSVESYANFLYAIEAYCPLIDWRVIPGNHDNNAHFDALFKSQKLTSKQSWAIGNTRIGGLDTRYQQGQGKISATELFDLHTDMIKHREVTWCIAMHHPPYALSGWMQAHECINHKIFAPWLSKQSNIACVLHGHLHHSVERDIAGVSVLGVPSTCWQFELQQQFSLSQQHAGFRLLEIGSKEQLTTQVVRVHK